MDLEDLIRELDNLIGDADTAADEDSVDESRNYLKKAKEILDAEFLND